MTPRPAEALPRATRLSSVAEHDSTLTQEEGRDGHPVGACWEAVALVVIVGAAMLVRGRPLLELDRFGLMGYDQAAYFVGARALTLGYWPYRQFTQVQPPGILLLLAPFALARSAGFTAAKVFLVALGGVNTGFVWWIARRSSGRAAASVAAAIYAFSRPSIAAHEYVIIEPLVTVALLVAVLVDQRARPSRFVQVVVGLMFAIALAFKLIAVAAIGAFAVVALFDAARRKGLFRIVVGFAVGVAVLLGPFFVSGPGSFVSQVVTGQANRIRSTPVLDRLLLSFWFAGKVPRHDAMLAGLGVAAVLVILVWSGVRSTSFVNRLAAVWLTFGTVMMLVVPPFYDHYAEFVAPPFALLVGHLIAARPRLAASHIANTARGAVVVMFIAGAVSTAIAPLPTALFHTPGQYAADTRLARALVRSNECVVTYSPEVALVLPNSFAYSPTTGGPTVNTKSSAADTPGAEPLPKPSLRAFERALFRCPWYANPHTLIAQNPYPGWDPVTQLWFNLHYTLIATGPGIQFWHRR